MRIMSHLLAKVPLSDLDVAVATQLMAIAKSQAPKALELAKADPVLNEFALTYVGCLVRVQLMLLPDPERA
jgi:hypothetical protein